MSSKVLYLHDQPAEPRRRTARVAAVPKRLSLGFGADSNHPSEFESGPGPPSTRSDISGSGTWITRSEAPDQVDDLIAQQGILLDILLRPLSSKILASEESCGTLCEGSRTKLPNPAAYQSRKARKIKVGGSETWHDEMNRRIDRMSHQLSFDYSTSATLAKYKSRWGHWIMFCDMRIQAE